MTDRGRDGLLDGQMYVVRMKIYQYVGRTQRIRDFDGRTGRPNLQSAGVKYLGQQGTPRRRVPCATRPYPWFLAYRH